MTEAEWLACGDPARMLDSALAGMPTPGGYGMGHGMPAGGRGVASPLSPRKLRLFACACVRALWRHLPPNDRLGVELAERWADGEDCHDELYDTVSMSEGIVRPLHYADAYLPVLSIIDAGRRHNRAILPRYAAVLRDIVGNPFRPVTPPPGPKVPCGRKVCHGGRICTNATGTRRCEHCKTGPCPWLTPDVKRLVAVAYEERGKACAHCDGKGNSWNHRGKHFAYCSHCDEGRVDDGTLDPARLAVLSDALEEAGCVESPCGMGYGKGHHTSRGHLSAGPHWDCERCGGTESVPHPIIAHLRSPGPHYRGMWSLDLVLGKG